MIVAHAARPSGQPAQPGAVVVGDGQQRAAVLDKTERRLAGGGHRGLDAVWLSNDVTPDVPVTAPGEASFHLVKDGRTLLATADTHGTWLRWLA